jgi:hypothetical protein
MKIMLLSFFAMIFTFAASAQEITDQNTWMEHPDFVIKGDELKNFPGGQLSEMLIGRLPGIDLINTANLESQVVFIVDGFVWKSIDAININNIEQIAYYRGGLNAKLGIQNETPNGVIVITTKTAKFKKPLKVDVNTILGNNFYKKELVNKENRMLQSYNVALSQGLDKFSWRASAGFNSGTRNLTGFDFTRQFQLNGDLRFSPLKWLDLGLNVNYAPVKGSLEIENTQLTNSRTRVTNTNAKFKQDNWNGTFYLNVKPVKGLSNEIKVLKGKVVADQNLDTETETTFISITPTESSSIVMNSLRNDLVINKYKYLLLQNDLTYRFGINEDKIKFKAGANLQYQKLNSDYEVTFKSYVDGYPSGLSTRKIGGDLKYYTIVGDLSINLYEIVSLKAGVRTDKPEGSSFKAIYAPFFYADLNIKQALLQNVNEVNEIRLFGSYGEYRSVIPAITGGSSLGVFFNKFINWNFNDNLDKMKAQSFGLKTMFFDRLRLSGDWYKNNNYVIMEMQIPSAGTGYGTMMSQFEAENSGWRVWGSADIFKNTAFKWNTGLNFFKNKTELFSLSGSQMTVNSDLDFKPALQAGAQQNFSYANFSLSLNGSAYFNHPVLNYVNANSSMASLNIEKTTFINLNYLSFGYNFKDQISGKKLKELNVSFVARNLVQEKKHIVNNTLSKTVGVALNASF